MDNKPKTVSLVLGSGGARGLAHIGVIQWLESNGFQIASISGSSIGALVGGIYAAGKLDEYAKWLIGINKVNMVSLTDFSWGKGGIVKGEKIIQTLVALVGNPNIEDLPLPFTAVATDILNEKEVWITQGRLFDAIRASISIPMFFTPYKYNGMSLIDGGVLNPLPITPCLQDDTDLKVVVSLFGAAIKIPVKSKTVKVLPVSSVQATMARFINRFHSSEQDSHATDWSVFDVASQALDSMQSTISKQTLAMYPPDFCIEIPRNSCGILEFDRSEVMIALGYQLAQDTLGHLVPQDKRSLSSIE